MERIEATDKVAIAMHRNSTSDGSRSRQSFWALIARPIMCTSVSDFNAFSGPCSDVHHLGHSKNY